MMTTETFWRRCGTLAVVGASLWLSAAQAQTHVIEVLADKDSRYKIAGERTPEITVKAGEQVLLRVTARRGKSWNRDGSIHGFALLRAKDRTKVEGSNQGGRMEPAVQAGQAGIPSHRSGRTGRVRSCLHRDLQRRPRRHAHEVYRAALRIRGKGVFMNRGAIWCAAGILAVASASYGQN